MAYRSTYYTRQAIPKIISLIPAPFPVVAVFRDDAGRISTENIHLIAVLNDGDARFCMFDPDGLWHFPDDLLGFLKYEYPEK